MKTRSETVEILRKLGIDCDNSLNLYGAYLYGAYLYGADLRRANLSEAYLYKADLSGADLSEADLRGARLYGADLRRADLRGADLRGANLYGADLRRANFGETRINWSSHTLISEILYREAGTAEQEMFAAWVGRKTEWCWTKWVALNMPEVDWALEVLCDWIHEDDELPIELEVYYENTKRND